MSTPSSGAGNLRSRNQESRLKNLVRRVKSAAMLLMRSETRGIGIAWTTFCFCVVVEVRFGGGRRDVLKWPRFRGFGVQSATNLDLVGGREF